jgi:hypothetical protein
MVRARVGYETEKTFEVRRVLPKQKWMENEHGVAAGSLGSYYRLSMTRIQRLDSSFTGLGDAGCLAQVRLEEDAVHAAPGNGQPHDTRVIFNMITDIREVHHTLVAQ